MRKPKRGSVRIISGSFRGRKIEFEDSENLRPTPDRIRETIFNWLSPYIINAKCLDLFAGSGILGFESLSRGAKESHLVEKEVKVVKNIKNNQQNLKAENLFIYNEDATEFINKTTDQFDIIFLDPPYKNKLVLKFLDLIANSNLIDTDTLIYFEWDQEISKEILPNNLELLKAKKAASVHYYLARVTKQ